MLLRLLCVSLSSHFAYLIVFGLRLSKLEFVGLWVELSLGAEMKTSRRPQSDEYSLGSEVLCYSSGPQSELPPEELQSDPWLMNQDLASHRRWQKKEQQQRVKNEIRLGN